MAARAVPSILCSIRKRCARWALTIPDLRRTLQSANSGLPAGSIVRGDEAVTIEGGGILENADAIADLIVGVHAGRPVFLRDIARVSDGAPPPEHYVWYGTAGKDGGGVPGCDFECYQEAR